MNRASVLAASLLLPLFAPPAAQAREKCTPIQFPQGQSAVIVKGIARNDEPFACYTLTTRRGRTATVAIQTRGPNDDTACNIPGVGGEPRAGPKAICRQVLIAARLAGWPARSSAGHRRGSGGGVVVLRAGERDSTAIVRAWWRVQMI
jgi:hypothetical protein